jgi:hypothetical protein
MFEPVNPLEMLMQAAAANPAKIPDFYRALLESELYILTPEAELEPGRRAIAQTQRKNQHRDRRIQRQDMASGVHRAKAHLVLSERAGDVPRSQSAQSF